MPLHRVAEIAAPRLREAFEHGECYPAPSPGATPTLGDVPWYSLLQRPLAAYPLHPTPLHQAVWPRPEAVLQFLEGAVTSLHLAVAEAGAMQLFGRWVWAAWYTAFAGAATGAQPLPPEDLAPPPLQPGTRG